MTPDQTDRAVSVLKRLGIEEITDAEWELIRAVATGREHEHSSEAVAAALAKMLRVERRLTTLVQFYRHTQRIH